MYLYINDLLARTNLRQLLTDLSPLPPSGNGASARFGCINPSHVDRRPSMTMFVDSNGKERCKCWSCGAGGTAIDVVQVARGVDVRAAIAFLADRAGVAPDAAVSGISRSLIRPARSAALVPASIALADVCHRYIKACERILAGPSGGQVRAWLDARRIPAAVLAANRVGADPGPKILSRAKGLPWHGVGAVFPAFDHDGSITYFQTRYLNAPIDRDKFDNPAGRLGSNPRLSWIRSPNGERRDTLIITEGIPDGLTAAAAGLDAVAVLGSTLPDQRVAAEIAAHVGDRTVLVGFDGDDAGRAAAQALLALLAAGNVSATVLDVPDGEDPNSIWRSQPKWFEQFSSTAALEAGASWRRWLESARHSGLLKESTDAPSAHIDVAQLALSGLRSPSTIRPAAARVVTEAALAVLANEGLAFVRPVDATTVSDVFANHPRLSGHWATAAIAVESDRWRAMFSRTRAAGTAAGIDGLLAAAATEVAPMATARAIPTNPRRLPACEARLVRDVRSAGAEQ